MSQLRPEWAAIHETALNLAGESVVARDRAVDACIRALLTSERSRAVRLASREVRQGGILGVADE